MGRSEVLHRLIRSPILRHRIRANGRFGDCYPIGLQDINRRLGNYQIIVQANNDSGIVVINPILLTRESATTLPIFEP